MRPVEGTNAAHKEIVAFEKAMSSNKLTERSLTESMGRMLAADPEAAGRFEAVLIGQLAPQLRPNKRAHCLVEHDYYLGLLRGSRVRRADLIFSFVQLSACRGGGGEAQCPYGPYANR